MKNKLLNVLTTALLLLISHVTFGQLSSFAVFTAAGAINNVGATSVTGDLGTNTMPVNGFPPGVVIGQIHISDPATAQAASEVGTLFGNLNGAACGTVIGVNLGNNQTLSPGVYCTGAASTLTGNLTLDGGGNPNAMFIIKIGGALATSTLSSVSLTNGASLCNVFFVVDGAVSLGITSSFAGTIVASGALNFGQGASLSGRALSTAGAINLDNNSIGGGGVSTSIITASGPVTFCAGGSVTLSGNTNGGTWSTGETTATIIVTTSGDYFVTNTGACASATSNHIIVTVNPLPNCTITGNLSIVAGQSTELCAPLVVGSTYLWSTGSTSNCITVSTAGTYTVTVTDALGCTSTCSATVIVTLPLPCTITGILSICAGQSTQLCVPLVVGSTYLWSNGGTSNCITVSAAGTYSVTVTTALGVVTTCSATVVVNPLPICSITGNLSIVAGQSTQLCVPLVVGSTYLWSNGGTSNCITVSTAGTYTVTITDILGCTSTCSVVVIVTLPVPCTITGILSICAGQSTQLCVPLVVGSTYLWSNGGTSNCITVSAAGTYSVTVTTALGVASTCSATVVVNPLPICLITGNLSIVAGQSTQLCVPLVVGSTYLWSTGSTSNCITVSTAGTFTVTITDILGCTSTCSVTVIVTLPLPCIITGNLSICAGLSTQLCVPLVVGSTYLWSNGGTSNCITVTAAGTYSVTVTTALGVVSTCSATVTVNLLPICTITGNSTVCAGQSIQLCTPLSATATYLWSTGATTNCINVTAAGTYTVTVTEGGCQSVCSKIVTLTPLPNCIITGNSSVCTGQSIQLCTPLSATATYLWSTGATTNCINVTTAGTFSVTVTEGGCQSVCSKIVTLTPLPNCTITGNSSVCAGQSIQLCTPLSATATYLWSTGATTNCINVTTAGTFSVTVTEGGCQSVCSKIVTLNPLPNCTITGNSSVCAGQSIQLCTPLSATATYLWSTGATTNCINVTAAGTYTVTVTEVNGCSSICSKIITLNPLPVCLITGNASICTGQSTQLCVAAGFASYLWSTGATTNCITVNAAGTYSVTVTDANGCSSICSQIVTVTQQPTCLITGNGSICPGQTIQLCVPAGALSYLWSTGATTNCITVSVAGTYSVTVTEAVGCQSICSKTVILNPQPTCSITGNTSICQGQSTQLCVPAGSLSYLWSTGATTNCITVNAAGTYSVTVTEAVGCVSICSQIVTLNQQPICLITGNGSICQGQSTQLCVPAGSASYLWSTGATTNCITVSVAGNYSVTVTESIGCISTCSKIVTVNPLPSCLITGNGSICQGQSTQLCAPAGSASYLWSTGATTNCITVNATGTYTVTVTDISGCSSICSKIVTVNPLPICTITGNNSICNGQAIQLCTPLSPTATYLWSTGATTNCISVNTAGTYSVTVTETGGCQSVCSKIITLNQPPICTITGNSSICNGQAIQLCTPLSATATYLWSTGATTNCITVNTAGTYSVTVTETGGCQSVCSKIVTLNQPPICTITGNSTICNGQAIQLCTPLSATATYLWSTGATTNCINVTTAGTYSVTVTETGGCQSVCSKIITLNQPSICTIIGNSSICNGQAIQLCTPLSATATYLWSTGATTNCITVNTAGTYSVTVTETGGCSSVCSKIVTLNQPPICTITGSSSICNGQAIQLCTPLSATATYLWSTGATTNCISVNTAGTYSVTVTETGGCSSVCSKIVTLNQPPICTIIGNSSICNGQAIQLCTPLSPTATYLWSTGATTNCINVTTAGTYSVTVTETGGCQSVCSKIITLNQPPICTITGGSSICNGQAIQLCTPLSATATYLWSTGATTNCINVTTAGTYSVTVTETGGCQSVCSKIITLNQLPICTITGSSSICNGQPIQLCTPLSATATYLWSTGATTNCITVNTAGTYSVTVTEIGGCQSVCSKIITSNQPTVCTITGNGSICTGQSTQLCVPAGSASYKWSTGATTNCITVSVAGNYSVTVTEGSGCQSICNKIVTVNPPTPCLITGNLSFCLGDSTQLCAPANCGSYLWSTGATTTCITVKTAGTYSVTITNSNGCVSICSQIVTTDLQSTCTITGNEVICQGQTTQLCVPAGSFSYKWSTGATTNCITVSTTGYYCVTITNANGCTSICSKTVTQSPTITVVIASANASCISSSSITATASGGTAPYRFLWSSGQTTATLTNVAAGIYTVTVTDANGCTGVKSITLTGSASNLACTITQSRAISCFEGTDGEAIVTATGGVPPYTYRWQNRSTLSTGVFLSAGLVSVTVTDANGCTTSCSLLLTQPVCTQLTNAGSISGNQNYCLASELTGISELSPATGGSGIIEYLWMYSDFSDDFSTGGWNIVAGATGKDLPVNLLPVIVRKTNFIRCVRRLGCCGYLEGNIISKVPTVSNSYTGERFPCLRRSTTFTAFDNGPNASYQWVFEGADIAYSNNRVVNVTFVSLGIKTIYLIINKNGCSQTQVAQVQVVNCSSGSGTFITFIAKGMNNKEVELTWVTANETSASKYTIEQSADNSEFTAIGTVASQNTPNNVYTFVDSKPKMGQSFYRIHQMTPSNEEVFMSKTEKVMLMEAGKSIIVYPNPVGSILFVEVVEAQNTEGVIYVYNSLGSLVKTQSFVKDQIRYRIDLGDLAQGAYIVRVRQNDGKTATAKITKL